VNDLISKMTLEEKVAQMRMFHAMKGIELDENDNLVLSEDVKERLKNGIAGIKNPGEHYSPERSAKLNNQLQKYIIENNRLGIPAFFVTESYSGVDAEGCTRFERPIALAASWDKELIKKVYDTMGKEA
jgi:beta-glucosidase